jgi:hypothetical protein
MKKPRFLKKFEFDDFPTECYLKTYLGSRVLIVGYNSCVGSVNVWLDTNTFVSLYHKVDLQASEEELGKAFNLLCNRIGRHESPLSRCNCDSCNYARERAAEDAGELIEYNLTMPPIVWERADEIPNPPEQEQSRTLTLSEILRRCNER